MDEAKLEEIAAKVNEDIRRMNSKFIIFLPPILFFIWLLFDERAQNFLAQIGQL